MCFFRVYDNNIFNYALSFVWTISNMFYLSFAIVFDLRTKVYFYEDIIKVTDIVKDKIIVYTTKGKFKADHELLNAKKFLEKMEEKNIPIKKNYFFGKNDN